MTLVITVVFREMHRNLIYLIKLSQKINQIKTFAYTTPTMLCWVFFPPSVLIFHQGDSIFTILAILINYCCYMHYPDTNSLCCWGAQGVMGRFPLQWQRSPSKSWREGGKLGHMVRKKVQFHNVAYSSNHPSPNQMEVQQKEPTEQNLCAWWGLNYWHKNKGLQPHQWATGRAEGRSVS